jgi:hypothetical protein
LASVASTDTVNPHRQSIDKHTCDSCHHSPDFDNPDKLCSSCHRCKEKEDASSCLNCHEHHGSAEVVGLLKKEWVRVEIAEWSQTFHDPQVDCLACHRSIPENKEELDLKFNGDINRLCHECHAQITCQHPVGITVPDYMKIPEGLSLDSKKRITCITCHRPECYGDSSVSLVGFSRMEGVQTNKICYQCHKPLVKNPHIEVFLQQNCPNCHGFVQPGGGEYAVFANSRLFCLLCHPERPHPARNDHRWIPSSGKGRIIKNVQLDSFGRITCTSCHNPHANPRFSCSMNTACEDCHSEYF